MVRRLPYLWGIRTRVHAQDPEEAPLTATDHTPHTPADQAVAQGAHSDDPPAPSQAVRRDATPGIRNQMTENPLLSLFGAVIVVLLGFVLTTSNIRIGETNDRITGLENRIDDRMGRLENKIDDRMGRLENRMDRLENRIGSLERDVADINRKLTALIAALNKTEEVEGALSG